MVESSCDLVCPNRSQNRILRVNVIFVKRFFFAGSSVTGLHTGCIHTGKDLAKIVYEKNVSRTFLSLARQQRPHAVSARLQQKTLHNHKAQLFCYVEKKPIAMEFSN